ncbi:MAG TPA: DNRLRE domain-containing protein, partial [Burkholderiales bacterium]|nr:DNRLRE domain-containing protein [Burkholderiales bacterium]
MMQSLFVVSKPFPAFITCCWLALQSAHAIAASLTLEPIADAYVRDGAWANANSGAHDLMYTRTRSKGPNYDSYLKFDTSGAGGAGSISAATLRLSAAKSGPSLSLGVYAVSSTSWVETAITWNNRPALGAVLGTAQVAGPGSSYYEIDVSAYVIGEKAAGRSFISFGLHNPQESGPTIEIRSRENTSGRPQLVITSNAAPTVSLASPASGAIFAAPATITL